MEKEHGSEALAWPLGRSPSRRTVLKGGAAGAAAVGLGRAGVLAQAPPPVPALDPLMFLLDRTTFGLNEEMHTEIVSRGYSGFLSWQLAWDQIDDTAADAFISGIEFPYPPYWESGPNPNKLSNIIGKTPGEIFWTFPFETPGIVATTLSIWEVVLRNIHSRRQLQMVMTDFWTNVLSTFAPQLNQHPYWHDFQENVIRPNALGNYGDMLRASAKHASMLLYLDQYKSDKNDPIENYARELLELHTVGIFDGVPNFSEADVVAVAKIFTGWSFHAIEDVVAGYPMLDDYDCPDMNMGLDELGTFVYRRNKHKFGIKHVLGQQFGSNLIPIGPPCAGLEEGEQLLDFLVGRDETAEHMARRMVEWFITDDLSTPQAQNVVTRVADAYKQNGADIPSMLLALFDPNYFHEIRPAPHQKLRRPLNYVSAVVRGLDPDLLTGPLCTPTDPPACLVGSEVVIGGQWATQLLVMGQAPGYRPSPDGYPPESSAWLGALLPRLVLASKAAHNDESGLIVTTGDLDRIFGTTADGQLAEAANAALFRGRLPIVEVRSIQLYLNGLSLSSEGKRRECLAMFFSAPSYQYLH